MSEAEEFERWLEEERAGLARDHATALERLARRAAERGDRLDCAEWWRRLAAQDPLNARVAIGLMEALVAAGDRTAALQHARVYEVLLQQELEAPPDHDVVVLAERIRAQMADTDHRAPVSGAAGAARAARGCRHRRHRQPRSARLRSRRRSRPASVARPPGPLPRRLAPHRGPRRSMRRGSVGCVALGWRPATLLRARRAGRPATRAASRRVTGQPGLEIHPALSPDGKFVAYAAGPSGRLRIYVRQIAGGRTIAVADCTPGRPALAPMVPGRLAAQLRGGAGDLRRPGAGRTGAAAGRAAREEPGFNGEGASATTGPSYLAWSPDGRRIVYAVGRRIEVRAAEGGPADHDRRGGAAALLRLVTGRLAHRLRARATRRSSTTPNAIGNIAPSAIWTVSASGGRPEPLTDAGSLNTSPVWLPDGTEPVVRLQPGRQPRRLSRRPSTGPASRRGAGAAHHRPAGSTRSDLSRDGRQLAYADFTEYANVATLPIPAAGAASVGRGAEPLTSGHQSIEGMAVSPGRAMAGVRLGPRRPPGDLPDAAHRRRAGAALAGLRADDFMPSWSPDGRELAYYGFRGGHRRLFVIPAIGGAPTPVVSDSGNQRFPDWSPDGRHLVYHSDRTGRFELYVGGAGGR